MNIKVKQTENLDGHIVTKGKLLKIKVLSKGQVCPLGLTDSDEYTYNHIIISETEDIEVGDMVLRALDKVIIKMTNTNMLDYLASESTASKKILALPEHFSPEILQMIVNGDLIDGQDLWVECEEPRIIVRFNSTFEGAYFIKLTDNHINIFPIQQNPQLQKALDIYIKEKHTQEECIGFIDGFGKAQENKMFSLNDMKKACSIGIDIACKEGENDFKPFEDLINNLTK
jgi:hypothetical protein